MTYGEVVSVPAKVRDRCGARRHLFFHHHVVMSDALHIDYNGEDRYIVGYDPVNTLACHAIAYRKKDGGELHMLADWVFLQPLEEEKKDESTIEVVKFEKDPTIKAKVFCCPENMITQGVEPGDVVGFLPGRDYRIKLDNDEVVYRMRSEEMMYVDDVNKSFTTIEASRRLMGSMEVAINNMIEEVKRPVDPEAGGAARKAELQSIKQTAVDCKELLIERQRLEQMVKDLSDNGAIDDAKDYSGGFAERFSK